MLPTPTATRYGTNQSPTPGAAVRPSLGTLVPALPVLPTPQARDGDRGSRGTSQSVSEDRWASGRRNLEDGISRLLPTPAASDGSGGRIELREETAEGRPPRPPLPTIVDRLLPTPTARDGGQRGAPGLDYVRTGQGAPPLDETITNLVQTVALLPTPRGTDGRHSGPNQRGSRPDDLALAGQVHALLPTPQAADSDRTSATMLRGNPTLTGAVTSPGGRTPPPSPAGKPSPGSPAPGLWNLDHEEDGTG